MTARTGDPASEFAVELSRPIPPTLVAELSRRVYFVSEAITGFRLEHAPDGAVHSVHVRSDGTQPDEEVAGKLRRMVDSDVDGQLTRTAKVVWRSATRRTPADDVFDRLLDAGAVTLAGEGQVAVSGPVLELVNRLDRLLYTIATTELDAVEWRYPTLISSAALQRSGYFAAFPQHVMLTTRLPGDADVYREFVGRAHGEHAGQAMLGYCTNADYCLPPTMCYHTFHQYTGQRLTAPGTVVTARGKSFRHESRYHASMRRLWDFTIRETVFLGAKEQVLDHRERFLRSAVALADRLGLDGWCEIASDLFFCAVDGSDRATAQRLLELKYELRLATGDRSSIAVGSFNLHEQHFGTTFGITGPDGGPVYSGCVGFGLERLAYAVLSQFGPEPSGWPAELRRHSAHREEHRL